MATARQKAAARRNIKKAIAANRRKGKRRSTTTRRRKRGRQFSTSTAVATAPPARPFAFQKRRRPACVDRGQVDPRRRLRQPLRRRRPRRRGGGRDRDGHISLRRQPRRQFRDAGARGRIRKRERARSFRLARPRAAEERDLRDDGLVGPGVSRRSGPLPGSTVTGAISRASRAPLGVVRSGSWTRATSTGRQRPSWSRPAQRPSRGRRRSWTSTSGSGPTSSSTCALRPRPGARYRPSRRNLYRRRRLGQSPTVRGDRRRRCPLPAPGAQARRRRRGRHERPSAPKGQGTARGPARRPLRRGDDGRRRRLSTFPKARGRRDRGPSDLGGPPPPPARVTDGPAPKGPRFRRRRCSSLSPASSPALSSRRRRRPRSVPTRSRRASMRPARSTTPRSSARGS